MQLSIKNKTNINSNKTFVKIYASVNSATSGETSIRPQYSQKYNFLFLLISNCLCGGTILWHPEQADLFIVATAFPFFAFLILI